MRNSLVGTPFPEGTGIYCGFVGISSLLYWNARNESLHICPEDHKRRGGTISPGNSLFCVRGYIYELYGRHQAYHELLRSTDSRMPGGLAQVNILLSTLMGGLSGSSLADAAMQCKMLVPTMESKGYSKSFSTVITAASGMVVPLIPPGVGLIIYGCINNISIGKLFIAGIGPGIVLCVTLMIFTHFVQKERVPAQQDHKDSCF